MNMKTGIMYASISYVDAKISYIEGRLFPLTSMLLSVGAFYFANCI